MTIDDLAKEYNKKYVDVKEIYDMELEKMKYTFPQLNDEWKEQMAMKYTERILRHRGYRMTATYK